ncbi:MAG: hypothetical protein PUC33_00675 [Oscillospiraceae bacterium]|nr:hypothetical protein [Oscillospiraceae bacterium]
MEDMLISVQESTGISLQAVVDFIKMIFAQILGLIGVTFPMPY